MEELGNYRILRLIGEGGMGKVYEAEEKLSGRKVALKILHPELGRSDKGRKLFLNEMQILAHLEHPNVVRSLASLEEAGELALVLELLDGETLRSKLGREGSLPWGEAVSIASQIASALAAAHGQAPPIVHRDLKPENIMVLTSGVVKVMDFGIAKVLEALHQTNTQSVGTLQYMSPEQIDARTIDHRSDLYCLGLILYELLAGHPPFHSASPRELLNLQCTAEPPALPDDVRVGLPKGVEKLVFELLEKAPEDRPYLSEDVVERLSPFETARPTAISIRSEKRQPAAAKTPVRASDPGAASGRAATAKSERRTPAEPEGPPRRRAEEREERASKGEEEKRSDTIELLERLDGRLDARAKPKGEPREVPTWLALALVLALSLAAGLVAYFVRASTRPTPPRGAVTARASSR